MLTSGEAKRGKSYLKQLWISVQKNDNVLTNDSHEDNDDDDRQEKKPDDLECLLKSKEIVRRRSRQDDGIDKIIEAFSKENRIDKETNLLQYWLERKNVNPVLFHLSQIVLSVPATQVSVERLFSSLKFILSPQRSQMSETLLNDILLIRANKLFNIE